MDANQSNIEEIVRVLINQPEQPWLEYSGLYTYTYTYASYRVYTSVFNRLTPSVGAGVDISVGVGIYRESHPR